MSQQALINTSHNQDTFTGPSFPLQSRVSRALWNLIYILLFRYSPRPLHRWRSFLLRCGGARVGKNVHVYPSVKIWAPWNLEIGDESGIGDQVTLYSQGKIRIGNRVVISQGTHLVAGTHDYTKKGFPLIIKPIFIGNQVWIAAETFVHPGITIEDGCVIGARSVVTKNMPGWMICTGHPCTPVKKRVMEDLTDPDL